jgi:5-(carboxyamino)imidazole ribonucleotide synthase
MKIGILGGGQLGRMLALAAHPLGIAVRTYEISSDSPAAAVSELHVGSFDDLEALDRFADGVSAVTYEFENVPVAAARHLAKKVAVYPPPAALEASQDRLAEKSLFRQLGINTPDFAPIDDESSLDQALVQMGFPSVMKTRRFGYDGKGQSVVRDRDGAARAFQELGRRGLILEAFVPFDRELSMIACRSVRGDAVFYPLVENHHAEGILRTTLAPAPKVSPAIDRLARDWAKKLLDHLNYVGVLAIELFVKGDSLLANEMAPRVHNSGHWTMDGAQTSQFENHLRAVAGLPLGPTDILVPTTMVNLIGRIPPAESVLSIPGTHLHLYGKEPRPGRKVGHINVRQLIGVDFADAVEQVKILAKGVR